MGGLALTRSKTTASIPASRRTFRASSSRPAFTIPWTRRVGVSYVRTGDTSTMVGLLDRDLPMDRAQVDPLAPSVDLRHDVDDQREGVHGTHEVQRVPVVHRIQVVLEPLPQVE